jgi:hypothetical protein
MAPVTGLQVVIADICLAFRISSCVGAILLNSVNSRPHVIVGQWNMEADEEGFLYRGKQGEPFY